MINDPRKSKIWRPYTQEGLGTSALVLDRAEGAYLYSRTGHKIFDGISSWWLTTHGHCQPEISAAIRKQVERLQQVTFANFSHEPAEELAELLTARTPRELQHVFLSDNGSTAIEVALKMTMQACEQRGLGKKRKFITFQQAYHGDTVGAMSVSGDTIYNQAYRNMLFETRRAAHATVSTAAIEQFVGPCKALLELYADETAALIVEPLIQGAGGMIVWPDAAVREVVDLAHRLGVYVIFDEVMTGFGRTGALFAADRLGVTPDLMCLSKGLTGGSLPLAVTLANAEIFDAFYCSDKRKMLFHGHSFTGNAISCAAAVANLRLLNNPELPERWRALEDTQRRAVGWAAQQLPVLDARVCGTMGAVELNVADSGYTAGFVDRFMSICLEQGLYARPLGHVLYLLPTYSSTPQEIEQAWEIMVHCARRALDSAIDIPPSFPCV